MKIFLTADMHFNHSNIIRYCDRKFDDVVDMNDCLVDNWNNIVSADDYVYHLGDFCFRKNINGEYQGVNYWKNLLNGTIVFVSGNHDKYLPVKELIMYHNSKRLLLRHYPIYKESDIPDGVDCVLCGHIHDKWEIKLVGKKNVINVGTDRWGFSPVDINDLVN